MRIKKIFLFLIIFFSFFLVKKNVLSEENVNCPNRYLTIINPVRGRNHWLDNSLKPVENQYREIRKYNFSATWLLQYDALEDKEIIAYINNNFSPNQELGLFLEISPDLASAARVIYPPLIPWSDPGVIFLSGYTQSERRKLIDTVFSGFKEKFGRYPVSVGAWWIDSYSLEYIKNKYGLATVLIVADQRTTDSYGVWGQWWGVPYYPSLANVLVPAKSKEDILGPVVLQWAQRDLSKAYGEGTSFSNYSLQANDYLERRLNTSYFKELVSRYLDCQLSIGQITVGLETGIESVKVFPEFANQLSVLSKIKNLQSVTMAEFADIYKNIYPLNPSELVLKDSHSQWILNPQARENDFLGEKTFYKQNLAFKDYFIADKSSFLNRRLPITEAEGYIFSPLPALFAFFLGLVFYVRYKLVWHYFPVSVFIFASFLNIFLSYTKFGRFIYFGPMFKNLSLIQFLAVIVSYSFFFLAIKLFFNKVKNLKLLMQIFPLTYGADFIVGALRYTRLQGIHYFGFVWDPLRFFGLKIAPGSVSLVNQDLSSLIAGALLKFDFNWIWESSLKSLFVYPLIHIFLGILIYSILIKLSGKMRRIILTIMVIFFCLYLYKVAGSEPRVVF
ncbi:MAG: hypothetical protein BWY24_00488 [Microgenomates group bacterium ADurb.Bin219]|nr:MAG: hypothetical protein BWY24_00488 [Microgenomates group bacterium ADurb.Bin219]